MSLNDAFGKELRDAIRPLRPDPTGFEAGVRDRIAKGEATADDRQDPPLERSSLLSTAASFIPVPLLMGGKLAATTAKSGTASTGAKILGYAALPAVSVFLMLGAFVFSLLKIRAAKVTPGGDDEAVQLAVRAWWRRHWWMAIPCYAALIFFPLWGDVRWLFTMLLVSAVALALLLTAFSRAGLATRQVVANTCSFGLMLLAICLGGPRVGQDSIHLVDQKLVQIIFYAGLIVVSLFGVGARVRAKERITIYVVYIPFVILIGWMSLPLWQTTTADDVHEFVEGFDEAEYGSATWSTYAMIARWARESGREIDWSKPRALLEETLGGRQGAYTLNHAMRLGLIEPASFHRLRGIEKRRPRIFDPKYADRPLSVYGEQGEWAIRVLMAQGRLTVAERDSLAHRVQRWLDVLEDDDHDLLQDIVGAIDLLRAIERPIDVDAWRPRVHAALKACHSLKAGGFEVAGGFQTYDRDSWGSYEGTWCAVRLMKIFGVPEGLDLNWVRSFLRHGGRKSGDRRYLAAVTKMELESLPEARSVTWLDWLRYERTLFAAILLVLLCLYATLRAPKAAPAAAAPDAS